MEYVLGFLIFAVLVLLGAVGVLAFSNAKLWVELKAMKQSTHTLTYIDPLKQHFGKPPSDKETEDFVGNPMDTIL